MKFTNKLIALLAVCAMTLGLIKLCVIRVVAHPQMLNVSYDTCAGDLAGDEINELWYMLDDSQNCQHIEENVVTIKYCFKSKSKDGADTWEGITGSDAIANSIKAAYANSMKKWCNVYFYSYDDSGNVIKKKLINLIEVTESAVANIDDPVIYIYPTYVFGGNFAWTTYVEESGDLIETDGVAHKHYTQWEMHVNLCYFFESYFCEYDIAEVNKARTGAHELGHVLGLRDVDEFCTVNNGDDHHHELLMGYGLPIADRTPDITYKDIAGVAITRGFHTDADHKWLKTSEQSDGKYKLICSICNGVKYVTNPNAYTNETYGSCGGVHTLSGGKMMAVASYGTKDYYKCKYCRYVAPFENIVEQNYVKIYVDTVQHQCFNDITGLGYTLYEPHEYIITYKDRLSHAAVCACGYEIEGRHWIKETEITGGRYGQCATCGALIDLGDDIVEVGPLNIAKVSVNGSYLLANGIAVIVDEDIEAYINGTLVFYDIDDVPVTQ